MRIGILTRNPGLYSTRRLARVAWERGHQVRLIDTTNVTVEIGGAPPEQEPRVLTPGSLGLARATRLPALDAVIPRIGSSVTYYGLAVVRQFEAAGVALTASSKAIAQSRDKLHSLQIMSRAGLPVPRTAVIGHPGALYAAIHAVGGLPVIIKLNRGTQGKGVVLVHDLGTAADLLRRAQETNRPAILQEFVAEAEGRDLRVIVVGDKVVAAMERQAVGGEFRANLHLGGTSRAVELDPAAKDLALQAAKVHELGVAGVDLILSRRGPLLLEVNSSPGLEGIEQATGIDVAGAMIDFVERLVVRGRRRR